jgi:hypothetical protein
MFRTPIRMMCKGLLGSRINITFGSLSSIQTRIRNWSRPSFPTVGERHSKVSVRCAGCLCTVLFARGCGAKRRCAWKRSLTTWHADGATTGYDFCRCAKRGQRWLTNADTARAGAHVTGEFRASNSGSTSSSWMQMSPRGRPRRVLASEAVHLPAP